MEKMMKNDDNDDEKWQWRQTLLKFWWRSNNALVIIVNNAAPCWVPFDRQWNVYFLNHRQIKEADCSLDQFNSAKLMDKEKPINASSF